LTFSDFVQGIVTIGFYTWPIWVFCGVVVVLDLKEKFDRQNSQF